MADVAAISNIDSTNSYTNDTVKKASGNGEFSSFLGENKTMDEIFQEASERFNVPVDLLKAIGKQESNFNANAVSRCGAQGVMQLMPATAKELGVTDAFDAEQNIMGGAKYISSLLKKYEGNTTLALAAYNAGSGNVRKYGGIPPFEETQNYVKKVMGYYGQGSTEIASTDNNTTTATKITRVAVSTTPVIQSNTAFLLTGNTESSSGAIQDLDSLFTYEEYMRFIELLLEEEDDTKDQNSENKTNSNSTNYTASAINYNVSVMNLLKDQNLI